MWGTATRCLGVDSLASYVEGGLDKNDIRRVDVHVDQCALCRADLSALALAMTRPPSVQGHRATSIDLDTPEPGLRFGRYIALAEIGRGGMGVVMRAYDPQLERTIALKLVGTSYWHEANSEVRAQLLREAQAMARLTSSHCVRIYDVVSNEEGLALAMELVEGGTLRDSMRTESWQNLLVICLEAGEGLLAAHAANIIHRDFKPENVLCSNDRKVLVSDFGLAVLDSANRPGTHKEFAGTPAYMAPELYEGASATPQSDQFSFCATTYEALYGCRAYSATHFAELRNQVLGHQVQQAPASSNVPSAIDTALRRGLHPDPAQRFGSMSELLAELRSAGTPAETRKRAYRGIAVVAITLAAIALAAIVLRPKSASSTQCTAQESTLDQPWGALGRTRTLAKLQALGTSAEVIARLSHMVDEHSAHWNASHQQICRATHVLGEQSEALLDARMECLHRNHGKLTALLDAAATSRDERASTVLLEAISELRPPTHCERYRGATVRPGRTSEQPPDPTSAYARLQHAQALLALGSLDDALDALSDLVSDAPPTPLVGRVFYVQGRALDVSGDYKAARDSLFQALEHAQRVADDDLIASIWTELLRSSGSLSRRFELAHSDEKAATAALLRIDPDRELQARFLLAKGALRLAEGQPGQAIPLLVNAYSITENQEDDSQMLGITILSSLCDAHRQLRQFQDAKAHCQQALARGKEVLGPMHPRLLSAFTVLGAIALDEGNFDEAREWFRKTLKVTEKGDGGSKAPNRALAFQNIGTSYYRQDNLDAAERSFQEAARLFALYHPNSDQRMLPTSGLGSVAWSRGQPEKAKNYYEAALDIAKRTGSERRKSALEVRFNLALLQRSLKDGPGPQQALLEIVELSKEIEGESPTTAIAALDTLAEMQELVDTSQAIRHAKEAVRLATQIYGQTHPALARSQLRLGNLYRLDGRWTEALPLLQRVLATYTQTEAGSFDMGLARLRLAQAFWLAPGQRTQARGLADQAISDFAQGEDARSKSMHDYVRRWRLEH